MEHREIAKQINEFFKTTFGHGINTIIIFQEYTGKTINNTLERSPWLPEENKKLVNEWLKANKKSYDDFKLVVDKQYSKLGALICQDNGACPIETSERVGKDQGSEKSKHENRIIKKLKGERQ